MSNMALYRTLHHRTSIVIFDVTFPPWLWQVMILGETLLTEVLDGIVVSISQEVVQLFGLCVIFQLIHQT